MEVLVRSRGSLKVGFFLVLGIGVSFEDCVFFVDVIFYILFKVKVEV